MVPRTTCMVGLALALWFLTAGESRAAANNNSPFYAKKASSSETLLSARAALKAAALPAGQLTEAQTRLWQQIENDFPVEADWALQDFGTDFPKWFTTEGNSGTERKMIVSAMEHLGERSLALRKEFDLLCQSAASAHDARWLNLYSKVCEQRRALRLQTLPTRAPGFVFTKHRTIRPSFFAYTEGQSDAQAERHFIPGAELCLAEWAGDHISTRTLLADPTGAIRDPAVSWDGERVLFAWKKSLNQDDYHLYEMEVASGQIRQITSGLGFADYEPAYLPNGDLIFASSRCVQIVDCWWTEVSNLYTCDRNGKFLRRLGFDQVHTVFPSVLDDGRVIYTRWDYNDRGQVFPQPLFVMNADGTGQTEFYGNNSWFPTTIAHARGIPGTQKVLAIFTGHHSSQAGKLGVLDPAKGRQENTGAQLVAPMRETKADRIDSYGQVGELFQYPYPLTEHEFMVTYAPFGWELQDRQNRRKGDAHFGIYWMDMDGHRELLVSDARVACQQPVPLVARTKPVVRPGTVDYRRTNGTFYVQDVYAGPSLAGVPRGTIKRLRVVALEFRPAGVGNNGSGGPGGGALISTPVAIGNGTWDVKIVLGDAKVHEDGSAFFTVPARTPVYFQALDEKGFVAQTMRSWSTLQPGENASCVGCHEDKNTTAAVPLYASTLALKAGPQTLEPFHGPARGFSFIKEVQPILDRHCIRCHNDRQQRMEMKRMENAVVRERDPVRISALKRSASNNASAPTQSTANLPRNGSLTNVSAFSLLRDETVDRLAKRRWSDSYLNLTLARPAQNDWDRGSFAGLFDGRIVNWIGSQSIPAPLPAYAAGAARSELFPLLERGHYAVQLSRAELDTIACWIDLYVPYCGDYTEANAWTAAEMEKYQRYLAKRKRMEQLEQRNIAELLSGR